MSRTPLLVALSVALLPGLLHADETTVYKSKNADGTSVYTQIESAGAESRQLDSRDPEVAASTEADGPKKDRELACERAKGNVELLASGKPIQRDKDGDGKPELLSAEELAGEKDLATRQAAAYCQEGVPTS